MHSSSLFPTSSQYIDAYIHIDIQIHTDICIHSSIHTFLPLIHLYSYIIHPPSISHPSAHTTLQHSVPVSIYIYIYCIFGHTCILTPLCSRPMHTVALHRQTYTDTQISTSNNCALKQTIFDFPLGLY